MTEKLSIRPYARLLTMLGEQLIKNEQIALVELIKNSYDADADWVKVRFENFGANMKILQDSKIIIEDNGEGMTLDTIKGSWMNPATPNKFGKDGKAKKSNNKKRIIQGEKGIGRFAILKLGRKIKIVTRELSSSDEYIIDYDLSRFDDDFLSEETENGKETKDIFLDEIKIKVEGAAPVNLIERDVKVNHELFSYKKSKGKISNAKGTIIEISNLKGTWTQKKVESIFGELSKLQSVFEKIFKKRKKDKFEIGIEINEERLTIAEENLELLSYLLEEKTVLKVTDGKFKNSDYSFSFKINEVKNKISFNDIELKEKKVFQDNFWDKDRKEIDHLPECGDFHFNFFIFDFNAKDVSKFYLKRKTEKSILKKHRVYLYRDGIRVFPYGDPDDDWLQVDMLRGTHKTGAYFSNDQVVGWVGISKDGNPKLKDKTNREGLIEEGTITKDFIACIQLFLSYVKESFYQKYLIDLKKKEEFDKRKRQLILSEFENLKKLLQGKNNKSQLKVAKEVEKLYKAEKKYLEGRAESTEELAAVGLSVESASHDLMLMLNRGISGMNDLIKDVMNESINNDLIIDELQKLYGMFNFVKTQVADIQMLFTSGKKRRRQIRVLDILEKVNNFYNRVLSKANITYEYDTIGSPLVVKCTDADLMQLLINLFDNSYYWLSIIDNKEKKILVTLDGKKGKLIFSDNGTGIRKEDAKYIFEPFFSGKGEEGRGLGLYISKRLMERNDYEIRLANITSEKVLSGANFVVNFYNE